MRGLGGGSMGEGCMRSHSDTHISLTLQQGHFEACPSKQSARERMWQEQNKNGLAFTA